MTEFLQQLLNALSLGAIYALIALGYTMVYGVLRFINFAHSDVFMVGSFIGYYVGQRVPENTIGGGLVVLFAAMIGCAILGAAIERFAYRPLRDAPRLAPLITAIGVSFLLQNIVMLIFGPTDKSFPNLIQPKRIALGAVTFTQLQLTIALVSVFLMTVLHLWIKSSRMGKAMRALARASRDVAAVKRWMFMLHL